MERGQLIWIMITGGLLLMGSGTLKAATHEATPASIRQ
jgi:hypothetical protein